MLKRRISVTVVLFAIALGACHVSQAGGNAGLSLRQEEGPGRSGDPKGEPKKEAPRDEAEGKEVVVEPYRKADVGALQVKGQTRNWFTVYQGEKRVGPAIETLLNGVIELPPGEYDVFVNRTKRTVKVSAGKKTVVATGTLLVKGTGSWYTPYEGKEARVASVQPTVDSPISLFAGTYSVVVQVGTRSETLAADAKVVAGKTTTLTR
jgi:hypothetical protein